MYPPREDYKIFEIISVKENQKYTRKRKRPRLSKLDLDILYQFCNPEDIEIVYDSKTNNLQFEKPGVTEYHTINGYQTGGQLIRLWLALTINSGMGRQTNPSDIVLKPFTKQERESGRIGKSNMLYVQAVIFTLRVGDTFTVKGGDHMNPDARSFAQHSQLFQMLEQYFGRRYTLVYSTNESDDRLDTFTLTRLADLIIPVKDQEHQDHTVVIECDESLADYLIMAWILFKKQEMELPKYTIKTIISRGEYHVFAMVNAAKVLGLDIICNELEDINGSSDNCIIKLN